MRRLPEAAATTAPASLPPRAHDGTPLDGMDPAFSRLVTAPESGSDDTSRTWHVLDNGARLAELGVTPVGTILCVHGNPTWSYVWRRLVSAATGAAADGAARAWRVVAVDQLEMGFSERTGVQRPLARRVADLGDLTDALGLDGPVVTLGHDWGGVVSLGWAVDHPEVLAGTMLLNTAIHQPEAYPIPAPLRLALAGPVLSAGTVTTPAFLETTLALAHPPLSAAVKAGYRAPYRGAERRGGIGGFVADIPVDASHESRPELDRIAESLRALTVPALMLWGPRDPIFSDRYLDDLVARLPHADVHRFEGAGHLVAEDVDYASAVLTWLDDQDAATPAAPPVLDVAQARPMWHQLDALRTSSETALVEMAPPSGPAPRVVSWRLLARRIDEIAAGLSRTGVSHGDRVSLLVPPGADLTAVLYACLRIGAVVVVADAGLGLRGMTRAVRGAQAQHVIGALPGLAAARALGWPGQKISTTVLPRATARALGVTSSLADIVDLGTHVLATETHGGATALPTAPVASDPAAILFTSGSTGPAKGVVYTHAQLCAVRDTLAAHYGIRVGTGLVAGFAPFALLGPALGTRSVTPDMDVTSPKTLTAPAVAAAAAAVDATVLFLSPAAIANVVTTADDLSKDDYTALAGVRTFLSAGAPVPEPLLAAVGRLMPDATPHTPYGMTEGLLMTDTTLDGIRAAALATDGALGAAGVCVGQPVDGVQVRISALDETGQATGTLTEESGVTGEIVVSAPHVKDRYDRLWLTERASRLVVAAPGAARTETGWHRTGDVGHIDADGRVWVEGRVAHVVVTADGVVTPVGVEQQVEGITAVGRAALVGIGPRGTQQLVVIVENPSAPRRAALADPELAAAVRAAVGSDVRQGRRIAAVLVVAQLPTDVRHNSKIDRARLAHWAEGVLSGGRMTAP
ncbi:alpha/beta fold hydrolase [Sanguibacter antarcticus]|uniref:Acyl-CoA synthetase (AMP-forming)/AMP-acid ligase II n=1 Tax=Sanguibacter antarcticus TaxID=372484 RepID=A0A2A9E6L9_9MICO|nr:alpha/beta fold hydrolase [Sanguibacter antarcticus]PFG34201.1 acyl-CoA synthetase (AMP-forming)/AMP-acid ligase II [Sanguibacter antarcticus]